MNAERYAIYLDGAESCVAKLASADAAAYIVKGLLEDYEFNSINVVREQMTTSEGE